MATVAGEKTRQGWGVTFTASLLATGKTSTGIVVPQDLVDRLGAGRRPAVTASLGRYTYRTTVGVMDGRSMLPVSAEHRDNAGLKAGDTVTVHLELDSAPRTVDVPPDFAAALGRVPAARRFFDGLSPSQQRWHILSVEGAKTAETRSRRIDKSVSLLQAGRAR